MSSRAEKNDPSEPRTANEEGFDARLRRLEALVTELEHGDLELEAAIQRYKEGVALLANCRDVLATYKQQVEELAEGSTTATRPYAGDPDAAGGRAGGGS